MVTSATVSEKSVKVSAIASSVISSGAGAGAIASSVISSGAGAGAIASVIVVAMPSATFTTESATVLVTPATVWEISAIGSST